MGLSTLILTLASAGLPLGAPDDKPAGTETITTKAAHDASAQVKLALISESMGREAERLKHLGLAVLADPSQPTARGLLGLVRHGGAWISADAVVREIKKDVARAALMAEYAERREATKNAPDQQYRLGVWCEKVGLKAEAVAHFTNAVRDNPSNEAAWKHLGYKKRDGAWVSDKQFAEIQIERDLQAEADRRWKPLLTKYKGMLAGKNQAARDEAEIKLSEIDDPRAAPSVWTVFAATPAGQEIAARTLGPIEGQGATRALAALAVYGGSERARALAFDVLKRRDGREAVDFLIAQIRVPVKYEVKPGEGPNSPGVLFVEGERVNVRRVYRPRLIVLAEVPPRLFAANLPPIQGDATTMLRLSGAGLAPPTVGAAPASLGEAVRREAVVADTVAANQRRIADGVAQARQDLEDDVRRIDAVNAGIKKTTALAVGALKEITGEDHGADPAAWRKWRADQQGLVYVRPPETTPKPTVDVSVVSQIVITPDGRLHHSCFAGGTPVRTIDGLRNIELVKVGDQVLSQDPNTGELTYRPVVAVHHNPPSATLRIDVGDDAIVATGIHRFWKAGKGWVMARDLKKGDTLRVLGGTRKVVSVVPEKVQPVFNLEVTENHSFLVGRTGALVHDNSLVRTPSSPFDVPAPPAVAAK